MLSALNLVFTFIFLYGISYFFNSKKKYNLPPGPWNIPFVGGIYSTNPHLTFQKWGKQYGPLIRTKFGLQDALIIDDAKLMKVAFSMNAFNGRPDIKAFTSLTNGKHGIFSAEGQEWAEQRRYVLRALRDFGFGKQTMEELVKEEIQDLLKWMKTNEGVSSKIKSRLILAAVSTLWTMIAGERQDQNNEELKRVVDEAALVFNEAAQIKGLWTLFPQVIDLFPKMFLKSWYQLLETTKPLLQIFTDAIQFHIKNPVDKSEPRDLIDVYLTEVEKTTDSNSSFYGKRGLETLKCVINDLYGAGQGTTPIVLSWGIIYLVRFPEVQKKFQQELDSVIGPNRLPSLADRPNLPYTEAMILEIIRCASIAPLGFFHQTTEDTSLGGYDIKKGTVVIPNVYSMDHSEKTYGDPQNFRPERFLSPDGQSVRKFEEFMPFGSGKRQCLGEIMGRDSFFLFITSIFQRFEIGQDPLKSPPSLDAPPGFFREPENFSVIFKERLQE